jgi:hypothetical protein
LDTQDEELERRRLQDGAAVAAPAVEGDGQAVRRVERGGGGAGYRPLAEDFGDRRVREAWSYPGQEAPKEVVVDYARSTPWVGRLTGPTSGARIAYVLPESGARIAYTVPVYLVSYCVSHCLVSLTGNSGRLPPRRPAPTTVR